MWNGAAKEACSDAVAVESKKDAEIAENRSASDQQQFASNNTANVPVSEEGIQVRSVFPQIASFESCPRMADDTTTIPGDTDETTILIPPPNVAEFQIECKTEPGTELGNSIDDDPLVFNESSIHIPVFAPMIKAPVVLLERCDKIWQTLQLIKTVQVEKPAVLTNDDCDKNEEEKNKKKVQHLDEVEQSESHVKNQPKLRSDNTIPPFKVSVLRTKKLYPCAVCGVQYLERRSLRKHSERIHGIIIPLQRKRLKHNTLNKKNFDGASQVSSISKENNNSEKVYDNKDSCEKATAKTKLTNVETTTASLPALSERFVKCTLCQQKVLSLRKHLTNYHKIGGSTSVMEQLESSLLSEPKTSPEDKRTTLKNDPHQDGFRLMDNENDIPKTSKVQGKRKYKLSYPRKKRKLNNERYAFVQNPPTIAKKEILNACTYKCDICLGFYKSAHGLYKHKRIHKLRGETKENFHKFPCRYFNSPFNKNYKSLQSSTKSVANNANNRIDEKATSQLNNSNRNTLHNQNSLISNRAIRYNERINKNNETTCICGRSFRNPHTLFLHKNNCDLCQNEDIVKSTRVSSDRDSGIGINITIKKRNDSYEIVGKDDEDKLQNSKTGLKEDTSSMSCTSNYTKDFTKASAKQQVSNTSDSSKYSKDHSILKLEDTDEDVIIDIEDDVQTALDENNTTKMIAQGNGKQNSSKLEKDTKDGKIDNEICNEVNTLKQMCQKVLDIRESRNIENKNKDYNQIKKPCKENNQVKNQDIHQNKRELRSTNKKRYLYSKMESDYSHNETKVCTMQFKPMICGYCKEQFNNIKLYDNHQCTVIKGRSFDEFSLQLRCFLCKEVLNSYSEFDDHMRFKHFDHGYRCFQCPERFTSDKGRLSHFHLDHKDLICRFCNKKITISLKTPHEGYHLGFGYPCHKCKKAYTNSRNLSYHKYTIHFNGADNLVTCTICLKSVKLKTFRGHMKCHKHNACYFCGRVFSDRVGLEYHTMMNHGTNSKLKCNICGTRFYTKKQLERHEKIDGCSNGMQQNEKLNCNRMC